MKWIWFVKKEGLLFINFKSNNLKNDINGPWQLTLSGETEKYFIVIEHKVPFIYWNIQNNRFDGTFKEGIFEAKGRIVDHLHFFKGAISGDGRRIVGSYEASHWTLDSKLNRNGSFEMVRQ